MRFMVLVVGMSLLVVGGLENPSRAQGVCLLVSDEGFDFPTEEGWRLGGGGSRLICDNETGCEFSQILGFSRSQCDDGAVVRFSGAAIVLPRDECVVAPGATTPYICSRDAFPQQP